MTPDITPLINALLLELIKAAVPTLTVAALSTIYIQIRKFRLQIGEAKWAKLKEWINIAVKAAEQTHVADNVSTYGTEKKEEVIELAQRKANELGFGNLNIRDLDALIEKTVFEAFNNYDGSFSTELVPGTTDLQPPFNPTLITSQPTKMYSSPPTLGGDIGDILGGFPNAKG